MSLTLALNTALSGLNINQQSLAVLSQNIANVNTPGYSRKIINQQAIYLDGRGVGVSITNITRRIDEYLVRSMHLQNSVVGRTAATRDYADRTQLLLGSPGSASTINAYTTLFFNALQSLSQTPEDATFKTSAVNAGVTMARQINQLANNLQNLRYEADQEIKASINVINSNLQQIFALNQAISENLSLGNSITELQDQRDALVGNISQYMDVQTFSRENGTVHLSIAGLPVLDDILYQLDYSPASSPTALANDANLSPLRILRTNSNGTPANEVAQLFTGGKSSQVVSAITTGRIKALLDQRDKTIPNMLQQLDLFAATFRDRFNALHNAGISFPGSNSYTGSRLLSAQDYSQWNGKMRLAVLGSDGKPIPSGYSHIAGGLPPLLIDLASLNTGNGAGYPSVQGIINEINQYYGPPKNKVQLGNLSNIRLASNVATLPGSPPSFNFDLDLENLSGTSSTVFVTNVQVADSTGADITSITQSVPSLSIDATNGITTTNGSNTVTITTTAAHGLLNGDKIYLPDLAAAIAPATDVNGIPLSELSGQFFTVSNVTSTSFEITTASSATADGAVASTGATVLPPYAEVAAGESRRTTSDGIINASLAGNSTSPFYTVTVDVAVDDGQGNITTSQITYQVGNSSSNVMNQRYAANSVSGNATLVPPANSNQPIARAILVDANGNELPKSNGQYVSDQQGFLKILANNTSYVVAIDSLDSSEQGQPNSVPPVAGTGRGFSHYFGLNDFFVSDGLDATANSAANLQVMQRLINNPSLISIGTLLQSSPPNDPDAPPLYTYERTIGDNSFIQQLSELGLEQIAFAAAGGLGASSQTFAAYAGQIISSASVLAASAQGEAVNAQTLLDGYTQQIGSISGVNLDEELANTIIYQNAYTASARAITVANDLFDVLLDTFR